MKKLPVIITMYDRPEFLEKLVDSIFLANRRNDIDLYCFVDFNEDENVRNEVRKQYERLFALDIKIETFIYKENLGGSVNNGTAIRNTLEKENVDYACFIESDIAIAKGYFDCVFDLIDRFEKDEIQSNVMQFAMDERNAKGRPNDYYNKWCSTIAPCFVKKNMGFFLKNLNSYLSAPANFGMSIYNSLPENNEMKKRLLNKFGNWFNTAWGGLMALNLVMDNTITYVVKDPYATHLGWYGWHSNKEVLIKNGITKPEDHHCYARRFDINREYKNELD